MKRRAILIVLTLVLLVAVGLFGSLSSANFFPDPGPDIPRIFIRSDGSIEPSTAPIDKSGSNYKLTGNIVMHTVVIQRDNIVLDGSDYMIEGNKSWMGIAPRWGDAGNNGIILVGRNHVNITNLNIEKFTAGVRITDSSHINIVGNSFKEEMAVMDTPMGIVIEASSDVLIESNNFTSISGPAIASNGKNVIIRRNTLTDIIDGVDGSISIEGSLNKITDNKIETAATSIRLAEADSNIIARNRITGGVSLVSCSDNQILENNLTSIRLVIGSNNTFFDNYVTELELDEFAANNTFYGNTFVAGLEVRFNDAETTSWDNGTIGNYWEDYNGTDSNGDGIGDSPYVITGIKWDTDVGGIVSVVCGQDNYPLVVPFKNLSTSATSSVLTPFSTTIIIASLITVAVVGVILVIYFKKRKH
jgi:nitrous oxidase accessory protein NosD